MPEQEPVITLDHEYQLVRLILAGEVLLSDFKLIITQTRSLAAEHKFHILGDVQEADIKLSLSDSFYLPRHLEIYQKTAGVKTALLITPDKLRRYRFIESVTQNLGINIRIFLQESTALEWLGCAGPGDEAKSSPKV